MFIHKAQNRAHHCLKIIFTKHQSKKKAKTKTGEHQKEVGLSEQTDLWGQTNLRERLDC